MANDVAERRAERVRGRPFAKGKSGIPAAGGSARATRRHSPPRCCLRTKPKR